MTLSEELTWRGFVNQTTYKDIKALDGEPIVFYFGVDPSAPSMQIGNLAAAMMVKTFIKHGHRAVLLVGGATGLIGDPDGKADERNLKSPEEIRKNKEAIAEQYRQIFGNHTFDLVDNYDWFKNISYLTFLRDIGKNVPMSQMLQREFVQSRLGEDGAGISYAEFSYSLIQAYDFLHLYRNNGVTLQLSGADQWGNSIAGVDLIRRVEGGESHVWTIPLIVNKTTGMKFGKSEGGAVWLDSAMTTPTAFYQFWMNVDDIGVDEYLKMYTELSEAEIEAIMVAHHLNRASRHAQMHLAREVTRQIHGQDAMEFAEVVTIYLIGKKPIGEASAEVIDEIRKELPAIRVAQGSPIADALVASGLASSLTDARRHLKDSAIALNGEKVTREHFEADDFANGRALIRKGKKFKDSALVETE